MKYLTVLSAAFFALLSVRSAQAAHVDLVVENESSIRVHDYHYEGSKYHYHETVKPGDTFEEHTETGENWAISDPRTNRIVKSLTVTRYNRTLRVDDRDLGILPDRGDDHRDHGHKDEVKMTFLNQTDDDLDIYAQEGFRFRYQGTIRSNRSAVLLLEPGQRWRAQTTDRGEELDDGIAPSRDIRITLDTDTRGGGHHHGHRDGDRDHGQDRNDRDEGNIAVTIVNRSGETLSIFREVPGGRRTYYKSLRDNDSMLVKSHEKSIWVFVDPETDSVLRVLEVPDRDGTLTLYPEGADGANTLDDARDNAPAPVRILRKIFGDE